MPSSDDLADRGPDAAPPTPSSWPPPWAPSASADDEAPPAAPGIPPSAGPAEQAPRRRHPAITGIAGAVAFALACVLALVLVPLLHADPTRPVGWPGAPRLVDRPDASIDRLPTAPPGTPDAPDSVAGAGIPGALSVEAAGLSIRGESGTSRAPGTALVAVDAAGGVAWRSAERRASTVAALWTDGSHVFSHWKDTVGGGMDTGGMDTVRDLLVAFDAATGRPLWWFDFAHGTLRIDERSMRVRMAGDVLVVAATFDVYADEGDLLVIDVATGTIRSHS